MSMTVIGNMTFFPLGQC